MSKLSESLPEGWCWTLVGELGDVTGGVTKNSGRGSRPIRLPYLRVANVYANELRLEDVADIDASAAEAERARLRPGDLLVVEGNGSIDQIGRVACWNGSIDPCLHQNHLIKVRFEPVGLGRWALYWLLAAAGRREIVRVASSTSGLYTLSLSKVADLKVPLAPLPEQARIVDAIETQLTRLDAAVAALERARANLKRYRASVLKAAVEGRLAPTEAELARQEGRDYEPAAARLQRILAERRRRWEEAEFAAMKAKGKTPKDDRWKAKYEEPNAPDTRGLPELPEGWCWTSLCQLKQFSLYGPRYSSDIYAQDGKLVLRTSDISESGKVDVQSAPRIPLSKSEFRKYALRVGDLLITRTGSLGTLAVFSDTVEAIPGAYLIQYRLAAPVEVSWFVFYVLKSPRGQGALTRGGAGVGRPNLNAPTIESIPIGLPPWAEQRRIIAELENHLSRSDSNWTSVTLLQTRCQRLHQSILKWAFEGRLLDQDPNDEPASVLLERIRTERAVERPAARARRPTKRTRRVA